jgi:hypothetical protein
MNTALYYSSSFFLLIFVYVNLICESSCLAGERENANSFIDAAMRVLKEKYKDPMQPIKLHPRAIGINERVLVANIQIQARLEDGYINKIGDMKRVGNAFQTVIPAVDDWDAESSVTEASIEISDIQFNATIAFDLLSVMPRDHVIGRVGKIRVFFMMSENGTTGVRDIPYFQIEELENVDIELKGPIRLLDRLRNVPVRYGVRFVMRTELKKLVIKVVTEAAHSAIRGMIDKSKKP